MKLKEFYRCKRCKAGFGIDFISHVSGVMCPGCHSTQYTEKEPTEEDIREMKEGLKAIQDMYEGENE